MANEIFGKTLRELRKKKGYTQQQAADMLNLKNKSTLGSWEIGRSEPDGYTFLKLCRIYEVEDIYKAFGQESAKSKTETVIEKYHKLKSDYRKIIDGLINLMLELQEEGLYGCTRPTKERSK